jgi:hypothetical protein
MEKRYNSWEKASIHGPWTVKQSGLLLHTDNGRLLAALLLVTLEHQKAVGADYCAA